MRLIRLNADALPAGSHIVFCGDYNVYTNTEGAFVKALWPFPHGKHDGGDEA